MNLPVFRPKAEFVQGHGSSFATIMASTKPRREL